MKTVIVQRIALFHQQYVAVISQLQHPLLLLVRLYWGYDFYQTGLGKLNNLAGTTEFFASLNIPYPHLNAIAAGTTELICGILLMIGLGSRYSTVPLIVILCIAFATDDYEALSNIASDVESFVAATPFQHLFATLIIFVFGAGALSADEIIHRIRRSK